MLLASKVIKRLLSCVYDRVEEILNIGVTKLSFKLFIKQKVNKVIVIKDFYCEVIVIVIFLQIAKKDLKTIFHTKESTDSSIEIFSVTPLKTNDEITKKH